MIKKVKKLMGISLIFFMLIGIYTPIISHAASAEIKITADTQEVTLGDNVFVYITIDSETLFGEFEANITYNDEVFEYIAGPNFITGGSGFLKISDRGVTEGSNNRKYALKFKAIKVGSSDISFSGRAMVYDYDTGFEMSVSSNVLTMNAKAAVAASTNANLSSLKISPGTLEPAFDKNIREYTTKVSNDVDKLIVSAVPEDNKATVSISGNNLLQEGENRVIITVIAESGASIKYNINVFRELGDENDTNVEDPTSPGEDTGVQIIDEDGAVFAVFLGKYQILEPGSEVEIPKGYIRTRIFLSETEVTAFIDENDLESEFVLLYAMNDLGETGFYRYNRIDHSFERYVPAAVEEPVDDTEPGDDGEVVVEEPQAKGRRTSLWFGIFLGFVLLTTGLTLVLYLRSRRD